MVLNNSIIQTYLIRYICTFPDVYIYIFIYICMCVYISPVSVCMRVCPHMHLEGDAVWILAPKAMIPEAMLTCCYVALSSHDRRYMWQTQIKTCNKPKISGYDH